MDNIKNWYLELDKKNQDAPKIDKEFKNHLILPNSRIALIGGSGVGKTNVLLEFLHRKNGGFYEIIIFTASLSKVNLQIIQQIFFYNKNLLN
jgi:ABC-type transporter Mla maintaining outer membrane lipid asymmetry ATPase subunit MlaF